jgi:hypothetical protein
MCKCVVRWHAVTRLHKGHILDVLTDEKVVAIKRETSFHLAKEIVADGLYKELSQLISRKDSEY